MKYSDLRSNSNITFLCKYHVVIVPKYRKKVLVGDVEKRLKQIVKEVCEDFNAELIEQECDKDHIHLVLGVDPQLGIHKLVKSIKGRSSRLLRQEFKHIKSSLPTLWTNSYFVATIGGVTLDIVKKYVENQKLRGEE
jgi:putative transposase